MIDLLGLMEEEARGILEKNNLAFTVKLTKPPDDWLLKAHENKYPRVVKQDVVEGVYELTVSLIPDNYRRFG